MNNDNPIASDLRHLMLVKAESKIRELYSRALADGIEQPFVVFTNATDPVGRNVAVNHSGEARVEEVIATMKAAYEGGFYMAPGEVPRHYMGYVFPFAEAQERERESELPTPMFQQPPGDDEILAFIVDYGSCDWWYLPVEPVA